MPVGQEAQNFLSDILPADVFQDWKATVEESAKAAQSSGRESKEVTEEVEAGAPVAQADLSDSPTDEAEDVKEASAPEVTLDNIKAMAQEFTEGFMVFAEHMNAMQKQLNEIAARLPAVGETKEAEVDRKDYSKPPTIAELLSRQLTQKDVVDEGDPIGDAKPREADSGVLGLPAGHSTGLGAIDRLRAENMQFQNGGGR